MSRRRPQWPRFTLGTRATVLSAAAAGAVAAITAAPAGADPGAGRHEDSVHPASSGIAGSPGVPGSAASRLDRLHEQAERATEKYNAVAEQVDTLQEHVERAQDHAARRQAQVNRLRDELGTLAEAEYRSGGVNPAVALILSEDPESYLAKAATLDRITSRQQSRLHQLRAWLRELEQQRSETAAELADLERKQSVLARHKKTVQRKLAAAQQLLNELSPAQRAARNGDPGSGRYAGGVQGLPDLGPGSARAAAAAQAVRRAVGRPYAWGQAGPAAFDCSGLTQWAYAQAGVALPRTSQEQGNAGVQVTLDRARPGDLVVYREDASHVAMYVGNGQVVHAPYPGSKVRYDPVDMMPITSVTRP